MRRKLVKMDLERMNLPEEYWTARVDTVSAITRPAVERYMKNIDAMITKAAGLIIHGETGVGKTTVAALISKEARSRGRTVFFTRVWELREMIRARIPFDADMAVAERVREVDVLVLDDLREEDTSEKFFTISEITELVQYRTAWHRLTIITSCMLPEDFDSPATMRLADVLLLFPVEGPNLHEERLRELEQLVLGEEGE